MNIIRIIQCLAVGSITTSLLMSESSAKEFYLGSDDSITLSINSELSIGAAWRLKDADKRFIGAVNDGLGSTSTTDDGNLNFLKNDTYTKSIKGLHDFHLSKDNFGAVLKVKYWYDKELKDESRPHGHSANLYQKNAPLNDDNFSDYGKFSGVELLDAYIYGQFDLGDKPLDIRLGRQVVNWGESTFIQGGVNGINPFDVSAFRRPGAQLKEALLPVGMLFGNVGLTDNLSVEAFYQYEWEKTQIDGCGTYFSGADFAADGCNAVTINADDQTAMALGLFAQRQADVEPDDGGQYGVALRYYAEALNETEFGFYYLNIHSRLPLINAIRTSVPTATGTSEYVFVPLFKDSTGGALAALNPGYEIVFPEDLNYYAVSFATNLGGLALSGEVSYKPDTPVQINGAELLNAVLTESPIFKFSPRLTAEGYGESAQGYDEFDVTQIQVTAVQFVERVLGSSRLTLIAEAGVVLTDDIESSIQNYGRNTVFGVGDFDYGAGVSCTNLVAEGKLSANCKSDGFTTESAWGYRLLASLEYPNAIAGITLTPTLYWSHDVSGYSPEPAPQFLEDRKSLGLSLNASYKQKYSATLAYTNYSGGEYNILSDKDNIALSFTLTY